MNFTDKEFESFRKDFNEAIKDVEDKHQISINIGRITYSEFEFTARLTAKKFEDGVEQQKFESLCTRYGFKPSDYKKQFAGDGNIYYLTGFNTRASKNPCIVYCVNEKKEYVCPVSWVRKYLSKEL